MQNQSAPNPDEIKETLKLTERLIAELNRIIIGQKQLHRLMLIAFLSQGHVLLEGVPGVGKTALVRTLAKLLELKYNRVQCTPDLMPGDILGQHILQENESGRREMIFRPGPVFTNLLLADEINRATPKTQSALLEAMQERSVTLLGHTSQLPPPFFVMATQNPIEHEGTYPLPEAQLDRFLFKLTVPQADTKTLETIITTRRRGDLPEPEWRMTSAEMDLLNETMARIQMAAPVANYIARLVEATHPDASHANETVKNYVAWGASPRAAISIAESARAQAMLDGRPTVGFEDVKYVVPHALNHRILLSYKARVEGVSSSLIIDELLAVLNTTGIDLPGDIGIKDLPA